MSSLVEVRDAQLGYSRRNVILRDVDFEITPGEFLGIVGPNGSGKTTLLRTLLGLLKPLSGTVRIGNGTPVRFGYVPQRETVDTLFPIPVEEIVMMGRYGRIGPVRWPGRKDRQIVRQCLEHVDIADLGRRSYSELSGGQRQRVLIARALASEPNLLMLDEPTRGMDMPSEHALLGTIRKLHREDRLTVVLVSHILGSIADLAERIAIISAGRVEEGARPEMLSEERLSRLYGMEVKVYNLEGGCAILPGDNLR